MEIIVKKADNLGRIVLPSNVRKEMRLTANSKIIMIYENGLLTLKSATASCRLCVSIQDLTPSVGVCKACVKRIKLL